MNGLRSFDLNSFIRFVKQIQHTELDDYFPRGDQHTLKKLKTQFIDAFLLSAFIDRTRNRLRLDASSYTDIYREAMDRLPLRLVGNHYLFSPHDAMAAINLLVEPQRIHRALKRFTLEAPVSRQCCQIIQDRSFNDRWVNHHDPVLLLGSQRWSKETLFIRVAILKKCQLSHDVDYDLPIDYKIPPSILTSFPDLTKTTPSFITGQYRVNQDVYVDQDDPDSGSNQTTHNAKVALANIEFHLMLGVLAYSQHTADAVHHMAHIEGVTPASHPFFVQPSANIIDRSICTAEIIGLDIPKVWQDMKDRAVNDATKVSFV